MKKFILTVFMLMAATGLLCAEDVTFQATVSSSQISLDEVLQLTLTVTGVNQDLNPINLPAVDGFSAKYLGPSTSVSIINGVYSSSRSFIYDLFPNKAGHFQIPAITATIAGKTLTTKPIDVDVSQPQPQAQQASDQGQAPSTESLKDKIKVLASVDKTDVYLNQRVDLTVKLLVNDVPLRDVQYPQFDQQGLVLDDFDKPEQSSEIIDGVSYDTIEFKTHIYPNHLGDLSLGPVTVQGNVLYKAGQNNPVAQDNDFFGSDVFSGFFDSYASRPLTVSSSPITLHVSALPQENRPEDFSGAIGQFDFRAGVSPLQVRAGDPLTLKMSVEGDGNFKDMKMPVFQAQGFKSYEPQIKNAENEKSAEQIIIPTSPDVKEVPALRFSYFDTSLQSYRTITQGPFVLQVTAPNPEQEFKAVGFTNLNQASSLPAKQSVGKKIFIGFYHILKKMAGSIWFWACIAVTFAMGTAFFLWKSFQARLQNDPAFARKLRAIREARLGLAHAEGYIAIGNTKEFYALLSKTLRDYLANKWDQPSAGLGVEEILARLKSAKTDDQRIGRIKSLFEQGDLVCFAGASRDASQMRSDLRESQNLIAFLEKTLK